MFSLGSQSTYITLCLCVTVSVRFSLVVSAGGDVSILLQKISGRSSALGPAVCSCEWEAFPLPLRQIIFQLFVSPRGPAGAVTRQQGLGEGRSTACVTGWQPAWRSLQVPSLVPCLPVPQLQMPSCTLQEGLLFFSLICAQGFALKQDV